MPKTIVTSARTTNSDLSYPGLREMIRNGEDPLLLVFGTAWGLAPQVMDGADYRRWLSGFHGGAMYIFGCHLIDLIVAMMGEPQRVVAYQKRTWPDADGLYDNGLAVLEYPHATATVRTAVVEVDGFKRRQLVICGD